MELKTCFFKKAAPQLGTRQQANPGPLATNTHTQRGAASFPPAPAALQRGICSAFSYPDP